LSKSALISKRKAKKGLFFIDFTQKTQKLLDFNKKPRKKRGFSMVLSLFLVHR